MEWVRFWIKGDKVIWMLVAFCAMVSILAVFSSSSYLADQDGVERTAKFLEQSRSVLIGLAALLVCYAFPLKWYRRLSFIFFGISVAGLALLYIPGMAEVKNGATRGLKVFGHTLQVFEFAKVGIVFYLARALELWQDDLHDTKQFALKIFLPVAAVCLLIFGNSASSAVLVGTVCCIVLFTMDVDTRNLLLSTAVIVAAVALLFGIYHLFYEGKPKSEDPDKLEKLINRVPTVESRIFDMIHPGDDVDYDSLTDVEKARMKDEVRQHEYAKAAISEGGLFGKGPGKSTRRYSLSMAFSDFIYASIVEEYGLIGGISIIMVYLCFLFRCIRLIRRCSERFTSALLTGLGFTITVQAFLHIFVNVRLGPITGQTLPLISHGGTAYMVMGAAFGIILSISRRLDAQDAALKAEIQETANDSPENER